MRAHACTCPHVACDSLPRPRLQKLDFIQINGAVRHLPHPLLLDQELHGQGVAGGACRRVDLGPGVWRRGGEGGGRNEGGLR